MMVQGFSSCSSGLEGLHEDHMMRELDMTFQELFSYEGNEKNCQGLWGKVISHLAL